MLLSFEKESWGRVSLSPLGGREESPNKEEREGGLRSLDSSFRLSGGKRKVWKPEGGVSILRGAVCVV